RQRLPERRDQSALFEQRGTKAGHQPPQAVRLCGELSADSLEDLEATVDLARLDHEEGGLERERRGRDSLHRSVVEVAGGPVALRLDRRVRPPQQPRSVLIAVLQEL